MKKDIRSLLRQGIDPDDIDELLDEEEKCRSTRIAAPKGTSGMSSERSRRVRKWQKEAVQRARRAKRDSDRPDSRSRPA